MKFELAKTGKLLIVKVSGELDHHFADEIRIRIDVELMKPPIRDILFDFDGLSFMDSSGIALILGRVESAGAVGARVHLEGLSNGLFKLVRLSGIERIKNLTVSP